MTTALPEVDVQLDSLPDIVFVIDHDGTIVDCRGGDSANLTTSRQFLIGKLITKCPFDDVGLRFEAALAAARNGENPVSIEYTLPGDDHPVPVEEHRVDVRRLYH